MPATRAWTKADWVTFERKLEEQDWPLGETISEKNINIMVTRLTKVLTKALDEACPLSPPCAINKNNPWYTPQLKQLRTEVSAAFNKQRDNNTEQNKTVYKDRFKRYKCLIKKTKNNYHAKYVDSIQNEEEMSHFVKSLLKQKTATKPSALKRIDGTYTKTPEESLIELASTHSPSHKPIKPCSYNKDKIPITEIHDSYGNWITVGRSRRFCLNSKAKKLRGQTD